MSIVYIDDFIFCTPYNLTAIGLDLYTLALTICFLQTISNRWDPGCLPTPHELLHQQELRVLRREQRHASRQRGPQMEPSTQVMGLRAFLLCQEEWGVEWVSRECKTQHLSEPYLES